MENGFNKTSLENHGYNTSWRYAAGLDKRRNFIGWNGPDNKDPLRSVSDNRVQIKTRLITLVSTGGGVHISNIDLIACDQIEHVGVTICKCRMRKSAPCRNVDPDWCNIPQTWMTCLESEL